MKSNDIFWIGAYLALLIALIQCLLTVFICNEKDCYAFGFTFSITLFFMILFFAMYLSFQQYKIEANNEIEYLKIVIEALKKGGIN